MTYTAFSDQALERFKQKQASFRCIHNPDRYSNWFYNQSTQLLRLYNEHDEAEEVFFNYIPVGSYSTRTDTWMWAWENEDSFEQSKYATLAVQEHGLENGFEKLSEGYFPSQQDEGWTFTAIALDLLGGMGGYKVKADHLEKYLLLVSNVAPDEVKRMEEPLIACCIHGKIRRAFICRHLNHEVKTGFEEAFPTYPGMPLDEEDDFQAWCNQCEQVRMRHDGWNDESMKYADIRLVCERCYFEIKEFNTEQNQYTVS